VRAMYLILQQDQPDDYVIATGITTTIRDFIKMACAEIGLEVDFKGQGVDEVGFISGINEAAFCERVGDEFLEGIRERLMEGNSEIVNVDPMYFRPTEVDLLIGDPAKSKSVLGWSPRYDLQALIADMMESDVKLFQKEAYLKDGGYRILNFFE
ncbi:MAG TPA: GDP-mannose 4,6-dehydratase, partial [Sunxiuqinia sp.]|nr:GDP-mannose 4,6-dehydratase [Sunxiuqinia sp.]